MYPDSRENFSGWLCSMLEKHNLIQHEAARLLEIPQSSFNQYCTGKNPCPPDRKKKIEEFFERLEHAKTALAIRKQEEQEADLATALHVPGLDEVLDRGIVHAIILQTAKTLGIEPGPLIYHTAVLFQNCGKRGVSTESLIRVVMALAAPKTE